MRGNSPKVLSNQVGVHPKFEQVLKKNLSSETRHPISSLMFDLCSDIRRVQTEQAQDIVLDSGCGDGESTIAIAASYPDHLVIGVDKSLKRLNRAAKRNHPRNVRFIKANLVEFWTGLKLTKASVAANFILYPNPWPKQKHLKKRWHGHSVMLLLPTLSRYMELRTNWSIYAQEFRSSLIRITGSAINFEKIHPIKPISTFEKKYLESKHDLFRIRYENTKNF